MDNGILETQDRSVIEVDAVVVGAGFGGLYAVHRLLEQGLSVAGLEGADGVGGVWYHNRYPGARVDVDSFDYCYYFSQELYREWKWSERYAAQPELLAYLNHVADRFDLRRHYRFGEWLTSARWDPETSRWVTETSKGQRCSARFLIMATGNLSQSREIDFPGLKDFTGEWVQASHWPHRPVDTAGKRIAVIGTGSSGIQAITELAKTAGELYVFQRTPNFSIPARNGPMNEALYGQIASDLPASRKKLMGNRSGTYSMPDMIRPTTDFSTEEQQAMLWDQWKRGGHGMAYLFADQSVNEAANQIVSDFVRARIRETVKDQRLAELLCPYDHPIGTRRLCLDTGYYEVFNLDHVTLVDVRSDPIDTITETGIATRDNHYEVDLIVFALGFDAFRGVLDHVDIRNAEGRHITDDWNRGPRTYLGLMTAGFPNLFLMSGPGSPSVLANNVLANEQHADFIADLIAHVDHTGMRAVEPLRSAQDTWTEHVAEVARPMLRNGVKNYMVHVNEDGSRFFIPYVGGFDRYNRHCAEVADRGYEGMKFT